MTADALRKGTLSMVLSSMGSESKGEGGDNEKDTQSTDDTQANTENKVPATSSGEIT